MKKIFAYINIHVYVCSIITIKQYIMKTELLNVYQIAQKIADIAKGETKKSLVVEIIKLTMYLQNKVPVYVLFSEKKELIYTTMNKCSTKDNFNDGYKLIMKIKSSKELNKYKIKTYE